MARDRYHHQGQLQLQFAALPLLFSCVWHLLFKTLEKIALGTCLALEVQHEVL